MQRFDQNGCKFLICSFADYFRELAAKCWRASIFWYSCRNSLLPVLSETRLGLATDDQSLTFSFVLHRHAPSCVLGVVGGVSSAILSWDGGPPIIIQSTSHVLSPVTDSGVAITAVVCVLLLCAL